MLIEIGILGATYYGKKLYDKNKKLIMAEKERINAGTAQIMTVQPIASPVNHEPPTNGTEQSRKQLQHYSNMGLVSMGLSAATQFINPVLAPISLGVYIYTTLPYLRDVEKSLVKDRKVDVNVLFFIADMLTLGISQYLAASAGVC